MTDVVDTRLADNERLLHFLRWNSYRSKHHKLVYVATPKAACTSLKWWFAALEGYAQALHEIFDSAECDPDLVVHESHKVAPHVTGLEKADLLEALTSDSYFRFAVVRNPYKRIFSAWQSKLLLREPQYVTQYADFEFFNRPVKEKADIAPAFEAFLEHLAVNEAPSFWDHHWTPQASLLRPDVIKYSGLCQIEGSQPLSQALKDWLGPSTLDPFGGRRTNESLIPYHPELVTERSAKLICRLYAEDFDVFGYDKQLPGANERLSADEAMIALKGVHALRARHTQMSKRSAQVAHLNQAVLERGKQIEVLQQGIAEGEKQTAERDSQLASYTRAAAAHDAEVAHLNQRILERDARIAVLQHEVARVAEKDAQLAAANKRIDEIFRSRSWRMTIGVRKGGGAIRRVFRSAKRVSAPVANIRHALYARLAARLVRSSALFDTEYYLAQNPDVRKAGIDAVTHYLNFGWREHRDPSPAFCTAQYLFGNPDVARSGVEPLTHYLRFGRAEGRLIGVKEFADGSILNDSQLCSETAHVDMGHATYARLGGAAQAYASDAEVEAIKESGLFGEQYYLSMYPDLQIATKNAVRHYCEYGWREGRNPSQDFDTQYYLTTYADVRQAGINPFWHYAVSGKDEGRQTAPVLRSRYEEDIWLGIIETDIKVVAFYKSSDWSAVRSGKPVFKGHAQPNLPSDALGFYDPLDSDVMCGQAQMARRHGIQCFCFDLNVEPDGTAPHQPILSFLDHEQVDIGFLPRVTISSPSGVDPLASILVRCVVDKRQLHIENRPVIIVSVPADAEDTPELFARLKQRFAEERLSTPFFIGTVEGTAEDGAHASLSRLCDAVLDLPSTPVPGETGAFAPIAGNGVGIVPYSVVAAHGVERINRSTQARGVHYHAVTLARDDSVSGAPAPVVYSRFDVKDFRCWLDAAIAHERQFHAGDRRLVFVNAWNNWNEGIALEPDSKTGFSRLNELTRALANVSSDVSMPKISVIVPNYKHELFLRRRLDSIYSQTYKNIEVLLLDDCSPDDSRSVLDEYACRYPEITRRIYNTTNSGGVFRQWAKGIKAATGALIWIAESDDYCDQRFLENLVPSFDDEAVLLAYGHSVFVDRDEVPLEFGFQCYVSDLDCAEKWKGNYVEVASKEVKDALGIKNTIPNASSVIFRKPVDMPLLDDSSWLSMRVAGDWVFYLHIMRGGKIAFRRDAINFFRRYEGSTADSTYKKEIFYREVGLASRTVAELYDVPLDVLERCRKGYESFYWQMVGRDYEEFVRWYDYVEVLQARQRRVPNIMISTMGFSPGGAEILPIRMANELRRQGHSVLLLSAGLLARDDRIRDLVRNDVPVVEVSDVAATREIIRSFGIEVLNTHQWEIQKYPIQLANVFDNLRVHVASLHGMIEHDAFGATEEQLQRADANVTTWVYTANKNLGPFIESGLYDETSTRFIKIPNGLMPATVVPVDRAQLNIPQDAFVLCCVSRAIPDKGWAETIEAVERARNLSGRDIRLILVGNGQVYDEYCQENPYDFVHFTGFSENSVGHYAAADMGVMLTKFKSESFPLTIVDCLFAGKPYIASDVGDIRNMLTEGEDVAGAVIELDNWEVRIDAVAQVIAAFASDRQKYFNACALVKKLANRYRIDMVTARYMELFNASRGNERLAMRKRSAIAGAEFTEETLHVALG